MTLQFVFDHWVSKIIHSNELMNDELGKMTLKQFFTPINICLLAPQLIGQEGASKQPHL